MTIDEAKEYISSIVDTYEICHDGEHTSVAVSIDMEDAKALEIAIASLEAWGKVKAEIDEYLVAWEFGRAYREDIRAIINKHLQEVKE